MATPPHDLNVVLPINNQTPESSVLTHNLSSYILCGSHLPILGENTTIMY